MNCSMGTLCSAQTCAVVAAFSSRHSVGALAQGLGPAHRSLQQQTGSEPRLIVRILVAAAPRMNALRWQRA